ncbi:uncharacterized protein LOC126740071 isoform X2 [Anthonomus grandis grandis]|uniref:uncharacterized protein LOC126740071 isoform X2 n=1 Tax=Anthonomus grandis grandis TaxID=2921223 RepID=UPI0021653FC4|nr:uncharacterized protein LOC126740071 isoform X2 [Anthonomus grandis grandis]
MAVKCIFAAITLVSSLLLVHASQLDRFFPPYDQEPKIEDEIEFFPVSNEDEMAEYDWAPPNNGEELPDDDWPNDSSENWIEKITLGGDMKRGMDFPRKKKSQVLCKVQKSVHHHLQPGYEFFPKSYTSYSCQPVSPREAENRALMGSHDTCYVTGENCITIEKEQLFLKRRENVNCWSHFIETVGAGCKCLSKKY